MSNALTQPTATSPRFTIEIRTSQGARHSLRIPASTVRDATRYCIGEMRDRNHIASVTLVERDGSKWGIVRAVWEREVFNGVGYAVRKDRAGAGRAFCLATTRRGR